MVNRTAGAVRNTWSEPNKVLKKRKIDKTSSWPKILELVRDREYRSDSAPSYKLHACANKHLNKNLLYHETGLMCDLNGRNWARVIPWLIHTRVCGWQNIIWTSSSGGDFSIAALDFSEERSGCHENSFLSFFKNFLLQQFSCHSVNRKCII